MYWYGSCYIPLSQVGFPRVRVRGISLPDLSTHQQYPVDGWHCLWLKPPSGLHCGTYAPTVATVSAPRACLRAHAQGARPTRWGYTLLPGAEGAEGLWPRNRGTILTCNMMHGEYILENKVQTSSHLFHGARAMWIKRKGVIPNLAHSAAWRTPVDPANA